MPPSAYSGRARKQISTHIRKHRSAGMPQDQAVAAALSEARRSGKKVPAPKSARKAKPAKASVKKTTAKKGAKRVTRAQSATRKQPARRAKRSRA